MMTYPLFGGYCIFWGTQSVRSETPRSVQVFFCIAFENRCIQVNAVIVTNLSIWYDDCRRPTNGSPRGGSVTKNSIKTPCPPCLSRGPEPEVCRIQYDFHGSGVNQRDSCLFPESRFFLSIMELDPDTLILHSISSPLFREFECSYYKIRND